MAIIDAPSEASISLFFLLKKGHLRLLILRALFIKQCLIKNIY